MHLRVVWLALFIAQTCRPCLALVNKVVVTGAGGRTGGLVFRKMLDRPQYFNPIGVTRTKESRQALLDDTGARPDQVIVADVSAPPASASGAALLGALAGAFGLVIATSAVPKPSGETDEETGRPKMAFLDGTPYQVDWLGQKNQISAAKNAGVYHVVLCSSCGGTEKDHMLNAIGKRPNGSGGNILHWKRKAEKYLIDSGMTYTVIHPGGLTNEPGGRRELIVGVNDDKMRTEDNTIPRDDVAEVMVQSLLHQCFENRSFDLVAGPDTGSEMQRYYFSMLSPIGGENTDYSLGVIPTAEEEAVEMHAEELAKKGK